MLLTNLPSYLLALQRVQPLHHSRVQLDGIADVREHLLERVRRLLVQEDAHGLAWLHAAPDHRHQLGPDELLVFPIPQLVL